MGLTKETTEADLETVVRDFHEVYYRSKVWEDTRWLGVSVLKNPMDLFAYQEILEATRPQLVVETGTYKGGSALFFATIMDLLDNCEVVTVDTEIRGDRPVHPRVTYLCGSSTDEAIVADLRRRATGRRTMVVLDSDHSEAHVLAELSRLSGLVSPGCYLVVEDTNFAFAADGGGGAGAAVSRFLGSPDGSDFEVDRRPERFMLTFQPGGWLRRRAGGAA